MKKVERTLQAQEVACVHTRLLCREDVCKRDIPCVRKVFCHQTIDSFGRGVTEFFHKG